ncbi:MAG TPA: CpaF family protein [Pirellulales bacterium]|nr:CpaF family protein [Pirellulales bacterium]
MAKGEFMRERPGAIDDAEKWQGAVDRARLSRIKRQLHERLITSLDLSVVRTMPADELRAQLRRGAEEICGSRSELLSRAERDRLVEELLDETLGLGPLEALMRDPTVSDILINGPNTVYVERRGRLERTPIVFEDEQHLLAVVQRIAAHVGRRIDEASPMVDARLPDGSRVNAVLSPIALDGALVSIRRFSARPLMAGDLIAQRSATAEMIAFLAACVQARLNIMISGGTGSGKTTLLNVLSGYIPEEERLVTIEDAAELQLQQPHVGRMETRAANMEGVGAVTARDLVRNALRMRPDRIIVGECRGDEALDMLQAMSTGHDGSLTTIHANDARDAIARLEMLVGMSDAGVPMWFIHRQIASAIQIVVQTTRLMGGLRKIVQISEITGRVDDTVAMHDLFVFEQTGVDERRVAQGHFAATGIRPNCLERLDAAGFRMPLGMFERRRLTAERVDALEHSRARS